MSEDQARLHDIRTGPWHERSELARTTIPRLTSPEAERYFRSHYHEDIVDPKELAFRVSFDQALEEMQLLELAVACGYLPLDAVRATAERDFSSLLSLKPARAFLQIYDYVPVRFLAARLGSDLGLPQMTPPPVRADAALRYATFLALHADFVASEEISMFTQLLDDHSFVGIPSAAFAKEQIQAPGAALTPIEWSALTRLCYGLVHFVETLEDLFIQLNENERPLFGCLYAYWLSHFFGVRRQAVGYRLVGLSFEGVSVDRRWFAMSLEPDVVEAEQGRLQAGIRLLRSVWDQTRLFIESLDEA